MRYKRTCRFFSVRLFMRYLNALTLKEEVEVYAL